MSNYTITWICPACGHKNAVSVEYRVGFELMYCLLDEGGCDEPFGVKWYVPEPTPNISLFDLKEINARLKEEGAPAGVSELRADGGG